MSTLQFTTLVSADGYIALPPIPEYRNCKVVVRVHEEKDELGGTMLERLESNTKTPEQDFLDFCEELAMPSLSDDEVEQIKYERMKGKYQ